MKTTKRLLVAVLALAMCASFLAFPALADEPISEHGTFNAVKAFQTEAKKTFLSTMLVDGVTGGDTWAAVARNLTYSNASPYYKSHGLNVMKPDVVNGKNVFVNTWGTAFHTIVGYIPDL